MNESRADQWKAKIISPEEVIRKIKPGMSIFIGTGVAEPRTLVRTLMNSTAGNLNDLELIQLVSFGDAISLGKLRSQQYRLKTFFSGWVSQDAIMEGRVDLIPSRFAWIPDLIESGQIPVQAAFVQITPPDKNGNCSLGVAVDAARQAMEKATLVIGEINPQVPRTFGDTFVSVSEFTHLVEARDAPIYFDRFPVDAVYDQLAVRVAELVEDRSCIAFSIGPLFEALGRHLVHKKHSGSALPRLYRCPDGPRNSRCRYQPVQGDLPGQIPEPPTPSERRSCSPGWIKTLWSSFKRSTRCSTRVKSAVMRISPPSLPPARSTFTAVSCCRSARAPWRQDRPKWPTL